MSEKIVILGGGSPFVPALFYAMFENKETFEGSEVCLMDIDSTRLPLLVRVGEALSKKTGISMKFSQTTDPKKALEAATYVMPGYRIGGVQHMRYDYDIPTKYGICGDETAGPGGTFMAQRTIPATLDYCRMIEDVCPDAWTISYVNPTNFIADAVRRETKTKFIAICDCFSGFAMNILPKLLNMSPYERRFCVTEDLRPRAAGVNHNAWLLDLLVKGEDGYPLLKKILEDYSASTTPDTATQYPPLFVIRLLKTHGYLNVCRYHSQMYWQHKEALKRSRDRPSEQILGWSESSWDFVNRLAAGANYEPRQEYCFNLHHARHAIGIIVSIASNKKQEWGGINFPNKGVIKNLPRDAIIEGPCMVDKRGLTPIPMGTLPKCFLGITQHLINWQELSVDAALSGDKDLLYQAILSDPIVQDMDAAKKIMDELLVAHAKFLPQFTRAQR